MWLTARTLQCLISETEENAEVEVPIFTIFRKYERRSREWVKCEEEEDQRFDQLLDAARKVSCGCYWAEYVIIQ
jgi:hypothetical protein